MTLVARAAELAMRMRKMVRLENKSRFASISKPRKLPSTRKQVIVSRRDRLLRELTRATLAELSPNEEHRAAAARRFQAVLNEPWWQ
jgi:hypothetical protein